MLLYLSLFLLAFFGMELVAILTHKYVMHGFLWCLHESHHRPRTGVFELNDLFAVFFSIPAVLLIWFGTQGHGTWMIPLGLGITAYGFAYFFFHDILVHHRTPLRIRPTRGYLRRVVEAHWIHHSVTTREGAVSFGFLWAESVPSLQAKLRARAAPAL
ncbi:MAG: sterol desaturase family protein [Chromatiales bacterium]|nr:sterol desaturase family protein [Chromatiales bacterium]